MATVLPSRSPSDDDVSITNASAEVMEFLPAPSCWFDNNICSSEEGNKDSALFHSAHTGSMYDSSPSKHERAAPCSVPPGVTQSSVEQNAKVFSAQHPSFQVSPPRSSSPLVAANHHVIAVAAPSPSWKEISSEVLPKAARELLSSSLQRICHSARVSYAQGRWQRKFSELGSNNGGYFPPKGLESISSSSQDPALLPPSTSLSWVDRQMVQEWRTYLPDDRLLESDEEDDFDRARTLVPIAKPRPVWKKAEVCYECRKPFGPTRLRHHCRLCGNSFCQTHSAYSHALPHLDYDKDVPERVCGPCKQILLDQNLAERVAWRLARCRDLMSRSLTPYFETGVDTAEQVALRIARAAIVTAKAIPLGAKAQVAVETVDVLRKYGLNGIYGIMLRKEFLAAADLLQKALGINKTSWPLSVHELSAAIFYALAQHRAMRGLYPDQEELLHSLQGVPSNHSKLAKQQLEEGDHDNNMQSDDLQFAPICDYVSDQTLASMIFYAPIALNFIYAEKVVDMQLLAAQQGWRLLYAYLEPETSLGGFGEVADVPATALFVHEEQRVACLAVRGTTTINDVVTDIRQNPVSFPELDPQQQPDLGDGWTNVEGSGATLAVSGMASAAANLYREHIDALITLYRQGYRIRVTGHSLGGGVATLLGILARQDLQKEQERLHVPGQVLRVYAYGTPSCVDAQLSELTKEFVTTAVLHDDVVPRLTPTSCRGLLKHLLHIRETWVKTHLPGDLMAITQRAKSAWAPRWRSSFTLRSPKSFTRYYKRTIRCRLERLSGKKPQEPKLLLEYMGGMENREALVIDGDEFFDPGESLIESEEENQLVSKYFAQEIGKAKSHEDRLLDTQKDWLEDDCSFKEACEIPEDDETEAPAVILEETPLPRMFVPGNIIHMYSYRGVYKAAFVPKDFRELRRLSLAGNMLSDHSTKAYYEALLEVRTVRDASELPPAWTAFDEDDTCSCCASRFTWASTSDSEAQEARDKHNCRSCGALVCDPCSKYRIPLPSIGITVPVRVCDRCYNDLGGVLSSSPSKNSVVSHEDEVGNPTSFTTPDRPERQRERRSAVVDDLASSMLTSALTCS